MAAGVPHVAVREPWEPYNNALMAIGFPASAEGEFDRTLAPPAAAAVGWLVSFDKRRMHMMVFRLDWKKWKAAVDEVEARRIQLREMRASSASWEAYKKVGLLGAYDELFVEKLTKLYSIRAHARGRVHRGRAYLSMDRIIPLRLPKIDKYTYGTLEERVALKRSFGHPESGHAKVNLTMADQAAYIGDEWKQFEKPFTGDELAKQVKSAEKVFVGQAT